MLFFKLLKESFVFAADALKQNKSRTFLSLLGITIGIITIISVFAMVDTFRGKLEESVGKLGSKTIIIERWPWGGNWDSPWWKYLQRKNVDIKEYESLKSRITTAEGCSFDLGMPDRTLKYGNNSIEGAKLVAVSHDAHKTYDLEFSEGRYFTETESKSGKAVCIMGAELAEGLFPNQNPIGKEIKVLGRNIKVIAVLKKEGEDMLGISFDKNLCLPLNFVRNVVDIKGNQYNPQIKIKGKEQYSLAQVEEEVIGLMRSIRKLRPLEEDDFAINKTTILTEQLNSMFTVINLAGWIIGGFSILVGGFGIANIMFVSVKERTNIIGIQKSLGAKNYFILMQFLFESIALSVIGGLLGLFFVFILATGVSYAFDLNVVLSATNIIRAVLISVIIGVISGFWPAYIASKLNPVDAIRSK